MIKTISNKMADWLSVIDPLSKNVQPAGCTSFALVVKFSRFMLRWISLAFECLKVHTLANIVR